MRNGSVNNFECFAILSVMSRVSRDGDLVQKHTSSKSSLGTSNTSLNIVREHA